MKQELTLKTQRNAKLKSDMCRLADYVLGGNFEEEGLLDEINQLRSCGMSRIEIKRNIKDNHIWYIAYKAVYGAREASLRLTEITREVLG